MATGHRRVIAGPWRVGGRLCFTAVSPAGGTRTRTNHTMSGLNDDRRDRGTRVNDVDRVADRAEAEQHPGEQGQSFQSHLDEGSQTVTIQVRSGGGVESVED
jgi:hypothetical protein